MWSICEYTAILAYHNTSTEKIERSIKLFGIATVAFYLYFMHVLHGHLLKFRLGTIPNSIS